MNAEEHAARIRAGLLYGLGAHACWGLMPLYFNSIHHVAPLETLLHRILWSAVLLVGMVTVVRKWKEFYKALAVPRTRWLLVSSTVFIAINWFVFLYGITSGQTLQNSLGYFINPLFNAALGVAVLRERLRPAQWLGLAVASSGIAYIIATAGGVPWIALSVASSFACYGLARKLAPVDGLVGLTAETLILTPLSAVLLGVFLANGSAAFLLHADPYTDALLVFSGIATVIPLLFFVLAARRLALTTLGFLQYVGPTLQFLTAIYIFREPLTTPRLVGFCCVWAALAIITVDSLLASRRRFVPEPV